MAEKGSGQDEDAIALTPDQWRRLHDRQFADAIYDRVRNTLFVIGGIIGAIGIGALLGPIQDWMVNRAAREASDELRRSATDASRDALNAAATAAARAAAEREVGELLRAREGPVRQALEDTTRQILEQGLITRTITQIVERNFEDRGLTIDRRNMAFRLLLTLDVGAANDEAGRRADAALLKQLRARLAAPPEADSGALAQEDQVLTAALAARADRPTFAGPADRAAFAFTGERRALAEAVFALLDQTRDPASTVSNALSDAGAKLIGQLEPPEEVATWLATLASASRPIRGRHSVAWELLLKDGRAPALRRLGGLLSTGGAEEARSALAALAAVPWPRLLPEEAAFFVEAIAAQAPDALLGWQGLAPDLLEARYALTQAARLGSPAALAAPLRLFDLAARTGGAPEVWRAALAEYREAAQRRERSGAAMAAAPTLPPLTLGPEMPLPDWAVLLRRALQSAEGRDEVAALSERLLAPLPLDAGSEAQERRVRRLGLLAFALAAPRPALTPAPAELRRAVLVALAGHAQVERLAPLNIAVQRLLDDPTPQDCAAALPAAPRGGWVAAALAACAHDATLGFAPLADVLEAVPDPPTRERRLLLWTLARQLRATPPADAGMGARRGAMLAASVGPTPLDAGAWRALTALRRDLRGTELAAFDDALLAAGAITGLFPAPEAAEPVPEWSRATWWAEAPRWDGGEPWTSDSASPRVRVACDPATAVRVELAGALGPRPARLGALLLGEAQAARRLGFPARDGAGSFRHEQLLLDGDCRGDALVAIDSAPGLTVTLRRERAAAPVAGAPGFEERATAPALASGQPVRVTLAPRELAFFRLDTTAAAVLVARTRNLTRGTDTMLAAVDDQGRVLAEDDDGGGEPFASLLVLPPGAEALRAGGFGNSGGSFDLLLEEVAAEPLPLGAPQRIELERGRLLAFRVELPAGRRYALLTSDLGNEVDTVITLSGPGLALRDDDGGQGLASRLVFETTAAGVHVATVRTIRQAGPATLVIAPEP
jgi:hypothetical protein